MKIKYLYIVCVILISIACSCSSMRNSARQIQDTSRFRISYKFDMVIDTFTMENFRDEIYVLQVGENVTKGFTYQKFWNDSLRKANPELYAQLFREYNDEWRILFETTGNAPPLNKTPFSPGAFASVLFKDYKQNEIQVIDHISIHSFFYIDELKPQNWVILDDTLRILGYHCQKAIVHWRGREWIAWFTPEITISEGPWKFYGLPGLITKLHDSEDHYRFELIGFEEKTEPIDTQIPRNINKIERKEFFKTKFGERGQMIGETDMAKIGMTSTSNQVELKFGYIELDY